MKKSLQIIWAVSSFQEGAHMKPYLVLRK